MKMNLHHRETLLLCLALTEVLAGCSSGEAKDLIRRGTGFFVTSPMIWSLLSGGFYPMLSLALFSSSVTLASKKKREKKALKIFFQFSLVNMLMGVI